MTELTFLLDLLLNHKLPKPTKDAIARRIKDVEVQLQAPSIGRMLPHTQVTQTASTVPAHLVGQAPSTIAAMMKHPDLAAALEPAPVTVIAQTPAAQAAMNARNEALASAMSGKVEKGRTSPRKF